MGYDKNLRIRKRMCEKIAQARYELIRKGLTAAQAEMLTARDLRTVEKDYINRLISDLLIGGGYDD